MCGCSASADMIIPSGGRAPQSSYEAPHGCGIPASRSWISPPFKAGLSGRIFPQNAADTPDPGTGRPQPSPGTSVVGREGGGLVLLTILRTADQSCSIGAAALPILPMQSHLPPRSTETYPAAAYPAPFLQNRAVSILHKIVFLYCSSCKYEISFPYNSKM